ncbi:hypothetical protein ACNKHS_14830 [Shigella flexneri]
MLWNDFLKHNPTDPTWYNCDRFISNGTPRSLYSLPTSDRLRLPLEE